MKEKHNIDWLYPSLEQSNWNKEVGGLDVVLLGNLLHPEDRYEGHRCSRSLNRHIDSTVPPTIRTYLITTWIGQRQPERVRVIRVVAKSERADEKFNRFWLQGKYS